MMLKRLLSCALALMLLFIPTLAAAESNDANQTNEWHSVTDPAYTPAPTPTPKPTSSDWQSVSATAAPQNDGAKTPKPTQTPKPTKTAKPAEAPQTPASPTPVPTAAPWFNDTALIGDSVSDGLRLYAAQKKKKDPNFLGELQFMTTTSYSLTYASSSSPKKFVKYKGKAYKPEDALAAMGAKKVFIMLGLNDIFHSNQDNQTKYNKLIDHIKQKNPSIKICLIGITPIVTEGQYSKFQNENVIDYNAMVAEVARSRGCESLNFNGDLIDKTGGLKPEYSRDAFVHLKGYAFEIYAAAITREAKRMG